MRANKGWTIIHWEKPKDYEKVSGIYLPSNIVQDKIHKQKSMRSLGEGNKPADMYRWGEVVDGSLSKGTQVYYSQYDSNEFMYNDKHYDCVRDEHLLAYEMDTA